MGGNIPIGAMGRVRPTDGLGQTSDWVDCPTCEKRRKTIVTRIPSEGTRYVSVPLISVSLEDVLIDTLFSLTELQKFYAVLQGHLSSAAGLTSIHISTSVAMTLSINAQAGRENKEDLLYPVAMFWPLPKLIKY